ncbi:antibiotic biosynthesis monooxygenase [Hahella sp. CCB-MM4]|uniref:antibiotic biosynthesis monooxygenase family protein n=1 Tax=Hahella sp. (strain CCB-MM4) TaxID=1926491 RepID=UPI000B9C18FD|nr:antibiotic biosynthesis monooxygenase family protein [Hahella sp. CCB-MM4]OZG73729.1 antibiotic biosynthesis monooxygenase [Hahella sp. CCB-MM4]
MIRIIIERYVDNSLEEHYETAAKRILQGAVQAPGFISGESLRDMQDSTHRVLLSTWATVQHWQQWHSSPQRHALMAELAPMLEREEKVTLLDHYD